MITYSDILGRLRLIVTTEGTSVVSHLQKAQLLPQVNCQVRKVRRRDPKSTASICTGPHGSSLAHSLLTRRFISKQIYLGIGHTF